MKEKSIKEEQKNEILKKYENDVRLDYEYAGEKEWWIGEKSTTTLKVIIWDEDDEERCSFIDFEVTANQLRSDTHFIIACLEDCDVNHALNYNKKFYTLDKNYAQNLFDWYLGNSIEIPITPCGMENYMDTLR